MSSELTPEGTQQLLLRLAEQLAHSSHELAKVAQQLAGLRDRLERIERSTALPRGDAEA
jgi:hypothetical protein